MNIRVKTISLACCAILAGACTPLEDEKASSKIVVNNDQSVLATYITEKNETVEVTEVSNTSNKPGLFSAPKLPTETTLTLLAEIAPPEYDDKTLQATEVHLNGSKAYVSYNYSGDTFLGAVDIIKINDEDNPELTSRVVFTDTDINAIERKGSKLYLAGATEDESFDSPAILKVIELDGAFTFDEDSSMSNVDLASFAGTDVDVASDLIYVASGATGGKLTILNADLSVNTSIDMEDPRGISSWRGSGEKGVSVITGGDDAKLTFFDEDDPTTAASELAITGASIDNAKATVERNKSITLLGAGEGGMQVICNDDNTVAGSIAAPTGVLDSESNVLDNEKTVTNASSAAGRFAYMANGEAGVYMAKIDGSFDGNSCDMTGLELIGQLQLGDLISVNHVTAKNDLLFVASGLGGLKIIRVDDTNTDDEVEDDE